MRMQEEEGAGAQEEEQHAQINKIEGDIGV